MSLIAHAHAHEDEDEDEDEDDDEHEDEHEDEHVPRSSSQISTAAKQTLAKKVSVGFSYRLATRG